MTDDFAPYPHAPSAQGQTPHGGPGPQGAGSHDPATADVVILVLTERGGQSSWASPNHITAPMTEREAVAQLDLLAQRRSTELTSLDRHDHLIRVSDREIVIYRQGVWTGDRVTRVICGRSS